MPKGLPNLGNTCYFNSAVQCLAHVPTLTNRFLRSGYDGDCELTREYSKLIKSIWSKDGEADPQPFLKLFQAKFPSFTPGKPHDTNEAVLCIIDVLEKSLGLDFMKPIFYSTEKQTVIYPGGESSRTNEIVSLTMPDASGLQTYSKHQYLTDYVDMNGKKYNVAALQTTLDKMGHIFTMTFMAKTPAESVPQKFGESHELFALVVHWGIAFGGHYAVLCKHKGHWRFIDDETVREVPGPDPRMPCSMAWYKKVN